ncbi:ABC transporter permease [Marinilactibacillus sp. GCM10026970]|uniref:ABC transporter permease n=1 Tax=Marinilactibacillus sp. GCM10026970 TaxID=3252642 RepID=UPI00360A712F
MRDIVIFTKKEWLEAWRTKKLLLILTVFVFFGVLSPLIAILTPEILKSSLGESLQISLPEPTSLDSWVQFYKNLTQIGIYLLAIFFSNSVNGEVKRGSLVNLVTKGLNRSAVITSKFLMISILAIGSIVLSFLVTAAYTSVYFTDSISQHTVLGLIPFLIFLLFFSAVVILGSTLFQSSFISLLFTLSITALMYLINIFESARPYNPLTLIVENVAIIQGTTEFNQVNWASVISLVLATISLLVAVKVMDRKKL